MVGREEGRELLAEAGKVEQVIAPDLSAGDSPAKVDSEPTSSQPETGERGSAWPSLAPESNRLLAGSDREPVTATATVKLGFSEIPNGDPKVLQDAITEIFESGVASNE